MNHIYVLFFVIISFVLFDAASTAGAIETVAAMFGGGSYPLVSSESVYYLRSFSVLLILSVVFATPLFKNLITTWKKHKTAEKVFNVLEPLFLLLLLVTVIGYLADGSFNPFLYFRF